MLVKYRMIIAPLTILQENGRIGAMSSTGSGEEDNRRVESQPPFRFNADADENRWRRLDTDRGTQKKDDRQAERSLRATASRHNRRRWYEFVPEVFRSLSKGTQLALLSGASG